jgi:hypothetical protein
MMKKAFKKSENSYFLSLLIFYEHKFNRLNALKRPNAVSAIVFGTVEINLIVRCRPTVDLRPKEKKDPTE